MRFNLAIGCSLSCALFLTACVSTGGGPAGSPGQAGTLPPGSCIGVVSALGHTFTVKTIGLMVFGNEEQNIAIDAWGIDNLVVSRVAAHVGPQVAIKRVPYSKETFASLDKQRGLFFDYEGALTARLQALNPSERCARYVVVTQHEIEYTGTNQFIRGLGVVRRSLYPSTFSLHAIFMLRLYDGQTFQVIRRQFATTGQRTFMMSVAGPHVEVEMTAWPNPPAEAAQSPKLRQVTRELVTQSMDTSLPLLRVLEGAASGT